MKSGIWFSAPALLALFAFAPQCPAFSLLGTGFTYQGRLNDGAGPANGTYDLVFTAYDASDPSGVVIAGPVTNAATVVSNGIFTVTVDFGTSTPAVFNFGERWLEIGARTNGVGSFVTLAPRQRVSATPYALAAVNAGALLGNLPASQVQGTLSLAQLPAGILTNNQTGVSLSGTFAGNGAGLTNVSASTLGGVSSNGYWQITGNAGTVAGVNFIGTTDNQPLEIRVNNTRAFRIEPTSVPSVEGGYFQNSTHGFTSAAIVGGGTSGSLNEVFGDYGFIGAGHGAKVGSFSAIADGAYNDANSQYSFIGSGFSNTNHGNYSSIGSGVGNTILSPYSVIGGGSNNFNVGWASIVGGGVQNTNDGDYSSIAGGWLNLIQSGAVGTTVGAGYSNVVLLNAFYTTIGGGSRHAVLPYADNATIGGGNANLIGTNALLATISGGNSNSINSQAFAAVIGGGDKNAIDVLSGYATISGGALNRIGGSAVYSTISGGYSNAVANQASYAAIGGGRNNTIPFGVTYATIGGGYGNTNGSPLGTIGGGFFNVSSGNYATISGGYENYSSQDDATVGGGQYNISSGVIATIGGGYLNIAAGTVSTIGGGYINTNGGDYATIAGGYFNAGLGDHSFIGGGANNRITGSGSTIAGGYFNTNSGNYSAIGGGATNTSGGDYATVGGGAGNSAIGYGATVAGGFENDSPGIYATVGGGNLNNATGYGAVVAGGGDDGDIFSPYSNTANGPGSAILGGVGNLAANFESAVGGGVGNQATNYAATVPGGAYNVAGGQYSFAAGQGAQALHNGSFVWADSQNPNFASTANDQFNVRAQGGVNLVTSGAGMAIDGLVRINAGGFSQSSLGTFNIDAPFIGGGRFTVLTGGNVGINKNNPAATLDVNGTSRIEGANNWSVTSTEGDFRVGTDSYRFKIGVATNGGGAGDVWMRAHGGSGRVFLKTPGGTTIYSNEGETTGVSLAAGGGAWANLSDRNAKENFIPVDTREILQRVASLPLTSWNYKSQEKNIRHIGPMAQDFASAFQVGEDERHITTIDSEGVALAAIQGLIHKLEQKLEQKETEITELQKRLEKLERLVEAKTAVAADVSPR